MNVAWLDLGPEAVCLNGEGEQGIKAALPEMTVGHHVLFSTGCRDLGRVHVRCKTLVLLFS
jgi:hypothetical protein